MNGIHFHLKQKDLHWKHTTAAANLLLLFISQSECVCSALALVLKQQTCRWRQRTWRKHGFFCIPFPLFIPPPSHLYKGWDHYKCHTDRRKLSITLLGLRFEGCAAAQFTAQLNRGWARQTPQLVQVTGFSKNKCKGMLYSNDTLRTPHSAWGVCMHSLWLG